MKPGLALPSPRAGLWLGLALRHRHSTGGLGLRVVADAIAFGIAIGIAFFSLIYYYITYVCLSLDFGH